MASIDNALWSPQGIYQVALAKPSQNRTYGITASRFDFPMLNQGVLEHRHSFEIHFREKQNGL